MYLRMLILYPEICANCQKTLDDCKMKKFNIHHTRYDVDPLDETFARFFCNSCNKLPEFNSKQIIEGQKQFPLFRDRNVSDSDPTTFRKGERIQSLLEEYLERRMCEIEEKPNKKNRIHWLEFRKDASNYCDCMPKTITEHMPRVVSKALGRFKFYESPSSGTKYIVRRTSHDDEDEE